MSESETQVPAEISDSPHFANLRRQKEAVEAQLAAAVAQNGELKGLLAANAVQLAGFKVNDEGKFEGPVALLVEKFQSTLEADVIPTKDAFLELAGQYGVTPPAEMPPPPPAGTEPSLADQIAAMQQDGTQLQQLGQPPKPETDLQSRMEKAQEVGDVQTGLALLTQSLSSPQPAAS